MTNIAELRRLEAEADKVKRYAPSIGRTLSGMTERPEGEYVRYADYLAMRNALPELLKALETLEKIESWACEGLELGETRTALITIKYAARDALPPHGGVDVG